MAARTTKRRTPMNFGEMLQTDVPQGRNGKHKAIVTRILSDLDQIEVGRRDQGAAGAVERKQGKSTVGPEPRHAEERAPGSHGQRRHVPVRLERAEVGPGGSGSGIIRCLSSTCAKRSR